MLRSAPRLTKIFLKALFKPLVEDRYEIIFPIIAYRSVIIQTLANAAVLRYHGVMKRSNCIVRLLALILALCALTGCALPMGDIDEYLSGDDVVAYLYEEADERPAADGAWAGPEAPAQPDGPMEPTDNVPPLDPEGSYTTKEDVARYLYEYGELPSNFITKSEARAFGWEGGGLDAYAPGKSIGGDRFGNYEGLLPDAPGREYHECDIDTVGASSRGAKRIVYSSDGLIYYTDDHYESFTLLYPEE